MHFNLFELLLCLLPARSLAYNPLLHFAFAAQGVARERRQRDHRMQEGFGERSEGRGSAECSW